MIQMKRAGELPPALDVSRLCTFSTLVQEAAQHARPAGVLELSQRLGLDLPDAHAQHALLARRQGSKNTRRALAQVALDRRLERDHRVLVLDEIAQVAVLLVADRRLEADRLLGDLEHLAHLLERHAELLGELLGLRLAAEIGRASCRE